MQPGNAPSRGRFCFFGQNTIYFTEFRFLTVFDEYSGQNGLPSAKLRGDGLPTIG
jgi:hypothetical protein